MSVRSLLKGNQNYWMAVVYFLMMVPPGMWHPSLSNILVEAYGKDTGEWLIVWAWVVMPLVGIFSSLIFTSLADRKMEAQKLLGCVALAGAVFLWLAFSAISWGWHPLFYLLFQGMNALISAPMFALITKIMLVNIDNHERKFPIYSLFGTLGWMMAGWLVSYLAMDSSPEAGKVGAFVRLGMGILCFMLPRTPPAEKSKGGWGAALGLNALKLFKNRKMAVFFIASTLVAIPYTSFYMFAPRMLQEMGDAYPTASMTLGQAAEIFAILLMSILGVRLRMRFFLVISMVFGIARFVLFALAGEFDIIGLLYIGVALHGPIYAFMSITGRMFVDKRVGPEMRGQAQALYGSLTGSLAGTLGSLFCGGLYKTLENDGGGQIGHWSLFWWGLAGFVLVGLIFFLIGYFGSSSDELAAVEVSGGDQNSAKNN